uniref:MAC/Perforin domain containing protein n=1 Tax=Meloidogyne hapla TaxID=6305 RepID=A0A1I8BRH0_MELHA
MKLFVLTILLLFHACFGMDKKDSSNKKKTLIKMGSSSTSVSRNEDEIINIEELEEKANKKKAKELEKLKETQIVEYRSPHRRVKSSPSITINDNRKYLIDMKKDLDLLWKKGGESSKSPHHEEMIHSNEGVIHSNEKSTRRSKSLKTTLSKKFSDIRNSLPNIEFSKIIKKNKQTLGELLDETKDKFKDKDGNNKLIRTNSDRLLNNSNRFGANCSPLFSPRSIFKSKGKSRLSYVDRSVSTVDVGTSISPDDIEEEQMISYVEERNPPLNDEDRNPLNDEEGNPRLNLDKPISGNRIRNGYDENSASNSITHYETSPEESSENELMIGEIQQGGENYELDLIFKNRSVSESDEKTKYLYENELRGTPLQLEYKPLNYESEEEKIANKSLVDEIPKIGIRNNEKYKKDLKASNSNVTRLRKNFEGSDQSAKCEINEDSSEDELGKAKNYFEANGQGNSLENGKQAKVYDKLKLPPRMLQINGAIKNGENNVEKIISPKVYYREFK